MANQDPKPESKPESTTAKSSTSSDKKQQQPDIVAARAQYVEKYNRAWQKHQERVKDAYQQLQEEAEAINKGLPSAEPETIDPEKPLDQQLKAVRSKRLKALDTAHDGQAKYRAAERKYHETASFSWWDLVDEIASYWREYWRILTELITGGGQGPVEGGQGEHHPWLNDHAWRASLEQQAGYYGLGHSGWGHGSGKNQ